MPLCTWGSSWAPSGFSLWLPKAAGARRGEAGPGREADCGGPLLSAAILIILWALRQR